MSITINHWQCLHVYSQRLLDCAPNRWPRSAQLYFNLIQTSLGVHRAEHFHGYSWASPYVWCFLKFGHAKWPQTANIFWMLCRAIAINFLWELVHTCPAPILPKKFSQQTLKAPFLLLARNINQCIIVLLYILNKTIRKFFTYYNCCNSLWCCYRLFI